MSDERYFVIAAYGLTWVVLIALRWRRCVACDVPSARRAQSREGTDV